MEKYQATVSSNCVYMNMYIYVCVSLSLYIHMYVCICVYVYMCVCVCVYIQYLLICLFLLTVFLMVSAV